MPDATVMGWHFLADDRRLQFGDGRIAVDGETLRAKYSWTRCARPKVCKAGMHTSPKILTALGCAPGPIICRVRVGGRIEKCGDLAAGDWRKVVWSVDGSNLLRRHVRWCALRSLARFQFEPPPVVAQYLVSGDEALKKEARGAARAFSHPDPDLDVAMDSVYASMRGPAFKAAWFLAWATSEDAPTDAEWEAQERELRRLVWAAHRGERIPKRIAKRELGTCKEA